jgi:hypothetical protein
MKNKDITKELMLAFKNASFNCKNCVMPYCDIPCTKLGDYESEICALICMEFAIQHGATGLDDDAAKLRMALLPF